MSRLDLELLEGWQWPSKVSSWKVARARTNFRTPTIRDAWEFVHDQMSTTARAYAMRIYGSREHHLVAKTSYALRNLWKRGYCGRREWGRGFLYSLWRGAEWQWEPK